MGSLIIREAGSAVRASLRFLVSLLPKDLRRYDLITRKIDLRSLVAHIKR